MAFIYVTETTPQPIVVKNGDKVVIDIEGGGEVRIVSEPGANIKNIEIQFTGDEVADTVIIDLSTFSSYGLKVNVRDYDPTDKVVLEDSFSTGVETGNPDEFNFQYIGSNGAQYDGFVRLKDVGERNFFNDPDPIIICFAAGTIIDTDTGPCPVESLRLGDLVYTEDNGLQPVRWIGTRQLDTIELARAPQLRPVRIRAGAMGEDLPYTDLVVSPQHRIKLSDWRAELLFGEAEVLTPAKSLVDDMKIVIDDVPSVTYYHLLFDRHEIVTSNGLLTESLHPGEVARHAMPDEAIEEFENLFGDVFDELPVPLDQRETARPVLKVYEVRAARSYAA